MFGGDVEKVKEREPESHVRNGQQRGLSSLAVVASLVPCRDPGLPLFVNSGVTW
jgi:hypothetical protein